MPQGLAINASNGCFITDYPANVIRQAGTFAFTVHVSDSSVPAFATSVWSGLSEL